MADNFGEAADIHKDCKGESEIRDLKRRMQKLLSR